MGLQVYYLKSPCILAEFSDSLTGSKRVAIDGQCARARARHKVCGGGTFRALRAILSRRVGSLQLLSRLAVRAALTRESNVQRLPLPPRLRASVAALFANTIR